MWLCSDVDSHVSDSAICVFISNGDTFLVLLEESQSRFTQDKVDESTGEGSLEEGISAGKIC